MNRIAAIVFAVCLTLPGSALAHDASKHKGKPVQGEVVNISKDKIDLKTASGTVPVTFSSKTKFEHGNEAVDDKHVTKGAQITVFGTKLPSGEMVAREVLIGGSEAHTQHGKDAKAQAHQH